MSCSLLLLQTFVDRYIHPSKCRSRRHIGLNLNNLTNTFYDCKHDQPNRGRKYIGHGQYHIDHESYNYGDKNLSNSLRRTSQDHICKSPQTYTHHSLHILQYPSSQKVLHNRVLTNRNRTNSSMPSIYHLCKYRIDCLRIMYALPMMKRDCLTRESWIKDFSVGLVPICQLKQVRS